MSKQSFRALDADALARFARNGTEGGPNVPHAGEANAVKVRRVMQITHDFAPGPFSALRIVDLSCGEGAYAVQAGNGVHRDPRPGGIRRRGASG